MLEESLKELVKTGEDSYVSVLSVRLCFHWVNTHRSRFVSQNVVNLKKGGVKVTKSWSAKTKNTWLIWQTGRNNSIPSVTT